MFLCLDEALGMCLVLLEVDVVFMKDVSSSVEYMQSIPGVLSIVFVVFECC